MTFKYAQDTLEHFFEKDKLQREKQRERQRKKQYLQLYTAIFTENKKVPVVLFGGTGQELRNISTPDLNNALPKIYEFWQECSKLNTLTPLFIIGHSFDEVFERKINLLTPRIPDIRMLQYINVHRFCSPKTNFDKRKKEMEINYELLKSKGEIKDEKNDFMAAIHNYLSKDGRDGKLGDKKYNILDWEVQAGEGTKRAEKIDFLAVERSKKWLTVIEIKFATLNDQRLRGSIFQGMDYCHWVEKHKYELAMVYKDDKIDTRRRTRLIIINGPKGFPDYYPKVVSSYSKKDKYQEIELYCLENASLPLTFMRK